ncbi:MAG: MFS transporter, partial [Thermoleophilia bacterium]|nr:MFS transporter [Thermoleophilia bacterium]
MHRYRWIVLLAAFLGVLGTIGFGRFGYSAILPSMQEDLGITSAAAGALASWNLGGYTIMAAVGGFLAARLGARKVATAGIVITAAGMLLTGLSNGMVTASAARLLTGLGSGMVLVPLITLMAAWFHSRQLGLASSMVSSGAALALIIAGLAVPPIISSGGNDGWRLAWYFFAGTAVCIGILCAVVQRDRPAAVSDAAAAKRPRAAPSERAAPGGRGSSPRSLRTMARQTSADFNKIVRSRYTWHLGLIYLLYGFAFLIYMTFFQKRLTADLDYSSEAAGYIFLLVGLGGFLGGALSGGVSDRIGRGRTIALMYLVMAAAAALFGWWPALPGLLISAFILGLAGMGFPGVVGAACGDQYGPVLASAGLGLVT